MLQLLKQNGAYFDAATNTGKNIMHISSGSNQPYMLIHLFLNEAQDISSVDENVHFYIGHVIIVQKNLLIIY